MDINDFADSFFEEAEELLNEMEGYLLELDLDSPDPEQLNAIFRAAHSIKGGAGAFGFTVLQQTTHILENLLDYARRGELTLRRDIVDTFLEAKDRLHEQLGAYRQAEEPDAKTFEQICAALQKLAVDEVEGKANGAALEPVADAQLKVAVEAADSGARGIASGIASGNDSGIDSLVIALLGVQEKDRKEALAELKNLGQVTAESGDEKRYEITLSSSASADDIEAVMCFVVDAGQLEIKTLPRISAGAVADGINQLEVALLGVTQKNRELLLEELKHLGEVISAEGDDQRFVVTLATTASGDDIEAVMCFIVEPEQLEIRSTATATAAATASQPPAPALVEKVAAAATAPKAAASAAAAKPAAANAKAANGAGESSSIRVPVEKMDNIINLVGELIITQSMLNQTVSDMGDVGNQSLTSGVELLQRNARDLQEAVMAIRMVQMDYVFSRFPRLVRDLAAKLGKEVELVTEGKSTELDKGLIERIIDPLTHLVRNSLDHGIETPEIRRAAGKPPGGSLGLSAKHQSGNVIIEVSDDGAGLNRDKLLAKARSNGLSVSDAMTDDEVWQLIFAPGFSTAEVVSDVSGRGVGMDVVKRNIQAMGGHVEITSRTGAGTTTRIVLPLTLAILDGMSVRVGGEMFILPLTVVSELLQPTSDELYTMAGDDVLFKVRDEYLPVVALHEVMDVAGALKDPTECIAVVVEGDSKRYALLIDKPVGQQQVVVKSLENNYRKVPGVAGATILGDGSVALILDVSEIHRYNHAKKKHKSATVKQPQFQWETTSP